MFLFKKRFLLFFEILTFLKSCTGLGEVDSRPGSSEKTVDDLGDWKSEY